MERQRGRSAVAGRPVSRLVRGPGAARRLRLARRGLGDAHARAAPPPRMARARIPPRGVRLGGGGELQAPRGSALRPAVLPVGESVEDGVWKVDDDFFVAWNDSGARGKDIEIPWHGRAYRVAVPPVEPTTALFLILDGLSAPPPGDAVVVVEPAQGHMAMLRRQSSRHPV